MPTKVDLGVLNNWYETKLWRQIEQTAQPEAESVRTTIKEWMPKIQQILSVAGTSPTDFTLHDSQHAFRVAELMVEFIPSDVLPNLSIYELTLLFFAAYLHDIGMSPTESSMRAYYDYLLTGKPQSLSDEQIYAFQRWLDEQNTGVTPPLSNELPTPSTLSKARLLITHYCRSKHIELAEEWIDLNLGMEKLGSYAQWISDLKTLCRSHHQGYHQLITELFNPKPVGSKGMVVHLRYLAIVLRIADIMDFDPERTPEVIFGHRQIAPSSIIYWHKDHHLSRILEHGRLTIAAEPPDSRLHRAIELTIDGIEAELRLARQINDELPFKVARFQEAPLHHRWDILPDIRRDIRPKHNAYEYINGSFRPDTEKMLQLLSGRELYGNELIAVRELLQNAFDAIREQIAYERLQKQNPQDAEWEDSLGRIHEVKLVVENEEERVWLVCNDDGAGMSKSIISNHLLVSGAGGDRADIKSLERRCRASGFELGRTGKFGIGVLSFFMLADMVQIRTRRSTLAEDTDSTGWYFETEGIGSFGELRKDTEWRQGTEVRLRLKPDVVEALVQQYKAQPADDDYEAREKAKRKKDRQWLEQELGLAKTLNPSLPPNESTTIGQFCTNLEQYIIDVLCFLPCNFQVILKIQGGRSISFPKGWRKNKNDFMTGFEPISPWLLRGSLERDQWDIKGEGSSNSKLGFYKDIIQKIQSSIHWEIIEAQLPGNLGISRIHVPVFMLSPGISPFYFDIIDSTVKDRIIVQANYAPGAHGSGYRLPGGFFMSWNGMNIDLPKQKIGDWSTTNLRTMKIAEDALIEIDWRNNSAGTISVSRETFTPSQDGLNAMEWVKGQVIHTFESIAQDNVDSPFITLNYLIGEQDEKLERHWLFRDSFSADEILFGVIDAPAIDVSLLYNHDERYWMESTLRGKHIEWNGRLVHQITDLQVSSQSSNSHVSDIDVAWSQFGPNPDRLVQIELLKKRKITPLWTDIVSTNKTRLFGGFTCEFPPEWQDLAGVRIQTTTSRSGGDTTLWNRNLLACNISMDDQQWAREIFSRKRTKDHRPDIDPRPYRSIILSSKGKASAWLTLVFKDYIYGSYIWDELVEHDQELLSGIWQLLFPGSQVSQALDYKVCFYDTYSSEPNPEGKIIKLTPQSCLFVQKPSQIRRLLPAPSAEWILKVK